MQRWSAETDLYLFTPEELKQLPDGIELTSINRKTLIKGEDTIQWDDVRFGYTAYGVTDPWNHPLKDIFLIFKLVQ